MNWNDPNINQLIQAILALKTNVEAQIFLRDLMTESEITEFSKRLMAAEMLTKKISYIEIEKQTGLSSATIARVGKWLNGDQGGYKLIIDRLHHTYQDTIA